MPKMKKSEEKMLQNESSNKYSRKEIINLLDEQYFGFQFFPKGCKYLNKPFIQTTTPHFAKRSTFMSNKKLKVFKK